MVSVNDSIAFANLPAFLRQAGAVTFIFLLCVQAYGQQDVQATQYMYAPTIVNPAYAGSRDALSVVALHRSQWVGLEGSPETQILTGHIPFDRLGVGLNVLRDAIGPLEETVLAADVSYHLPVSENAKISLGLRAGANFLNLNASELTNFGIDPQVTAAQQTRALPVLGTGVFYYTDRFYSGLGLPNVLTTDQYDNISDQTFQAQEDIHYFFTSGYVFQLSDDLKLKPATMVKYVAEAPIQVDLTLNAMYAEQFILGVAYRSTAAFSGLVGWQLDESWLVGFAYDREVTDLGNTAFNDGSFEIFLRYELPVLFPGKKILTPRFF